MKRGAPEDVRRSLTLFAGFLLGMYGAVFLHELGHALGHWLNGGTVTALVMEAPLPVGHVTGTASGRFLPVWGGVGFGVLLAIVPLAFARRLSAKSPVRFGLLMVAAFGLAHNGMYLFVGSIVPFADASTMIGLGASRWLLSLLGALLLAGFVVVLATAVPAVGLEASEPRWKWVVAVEVGLFPIPALMALAVLFLRVPIDVRVPTLIFVGFYAVTFAVAACRAHVRTRHGGVDCRNYQMTPHWSLTSGLIGAGLLQIALQWLAFGHK